MKRRAGVMVKEMEVREECLYCHGYAKLGKPCPACGDVKLEDSSRPDPSPQPTSMSHHPISLFEPWIAGV
jgi:hypothetical protein